MDELETDHVPTGHRELTDPTDYGHGHANEPEYLGDGDQAGHAADEQAEPGDLMPAPLPDEPGTDDSADLTEQQTAERILAMRDADAQEFGRRFLT